MSWIYSSGVSSSFNMSTPPTQNADPLATSFSFEGSVVLIHNEPSPWLSMIRNTFPDYIPSSPDKFTTLRLFYFPSEGLWECFIHVNVACVVPKYVVAKGDEQVNVIIKYLMMTIRNLTS